MDSLGNFNCVIIIVGCWILDSNYEQALHLKRESLDLIFSPSIGEEQVVSFESFLFAIIYMWAPGNPKIG